MSYSNYRSRKVPGIISYATDLVRYRHLCWNLVGSDLRSRFRRSRLGILWAIIQPLAYSLIIAWAWGTIFKSTSYWEFAVYVFSGMLVWEFVGNTTLGSLDGLLNAVGYLRQSRVPLFVFQIRVPLVGLVIFGSGVVGLAIMLLATGTSPPPGPHLLLVPAFMAILLAFATPIAVICSILGAQMRDLKHITGIALQALFFLSPVMIERRFLDEEQLKILNYANPHVPLIDMFPAPIHDDNPKAARFGASLPSAAGND